MAESAADGVVNHKGQVFAGVSGDEVHAGLYVWMARWFRVRSV